MVDLFSEQAHSVTRGPAPHCEPSSASEQPQGPQGCDGRNDPSWVLGDRWWIGLLAQCSHWGISSLGCSPCIQCFIHLKTGGGNSLVEAERLVHVGCGFLRAFLLISQQTVDRAQGWALRTLAARIWVLPLTLDQSGLYLFSPQAKEAWWRGACLGCALNTHSPVLFLLFVYGDNHPKRPY